MKTIRKVKNLSEIVKIAEAAKKDGLTIVTTNGCFDLVHVGHIHNLEKAKSYGDILIVGINSDASVRNNKGPSRPIIPQRERAEVIAALGAVDYVFIFNDKTPIPWITKIKPHIHAKGADRSPRAIVEKTTVEKYGGKIVRIPYQKGKSTTNIIKKIKI